MPEWVDVAFAEYARRVSGELRLELRAVKSDPRTAGRTVARMLEEEAKRIDAALAPGMRRVALDERGREYDTAGFARMLGAWMAEGRDVAFLIGGPDGLAPAVKESADERIALSRLTLPHGLARVVLAEQLYRAHSLLRGHPYHRE